MSDVELRELDAGLRAALRRLPEPGVPVAAGFPRDEDTDAIDASELGALGFAIVADGAVVGTCGTHGPPGRDGAVELGWGLVPCARGRGIGTAAVALLLSEVRARHGHVALVAHTEWRRADHGLVADSPASEAILVAHGFHSPRVPEAPGRRAWRLELG